MTRAPAECGGSVVGTIGHDGTLTAACARCGWSARWTRAEVAMWFSAGWHFPACAQPAKAVRR